MRRHILAVIALLVATASCQDDPPAPEQKDDPKVEVADADTGEEYPETRQVFGLPLPPEVTDMRRGPHYADVGTTLTIDELEQFFRSRLVDYEFIRRSKNRLHLVGLRETMPNIVVMRQSVLGPRRIRYTLPIGHTMREYVKKHPVKTPEPGDKIETKLSTGDKLAPGAVYGKPYTPKPGDPLYTENNRPNFGKPFGKWVLN